MDNNYNRFMEEFKQFEKDSHDKKLKNVKKYSKEELEEFDRELRELEAQELADVKLNDSNSELDKMHADYLSQQLKNNVDKISDYEVQKLNKRVTDSLNALKKHKV